MTDAYKAILLNDKGVVLSGAHSRQSRISLARQSKRWTVLMLYITALFLAFFVQVDTSGLDIEGKCLSSRSSAHEALMRYSKKHGVLREF